MPTLVFDRTDAPARSAGPVARLFAALAGWHRRRATRRALSALDDRQLADIGLPQRCGEVDSTALLGEFEYGWTVRPAANANHRLHASR